VATTGASKHVWANATSVVLLATATCGIYTIIGVNSDTWAKNM
jgi:hypothetical protein